MIDDIKVDEDAEEGLDEFEGKTGFFVRREIETLKAMLTIAEEMNRGNMPGLLETRQAVKKSVNELCEFFKEFVKFL